MRYQYTWFRFFHSTVRDAKLLDQPTDIRWVWPALLTLASESRVRGTILGAEAQPAYIAVMAVVPVEAVQRALKVFSDRKMVRSTKRGIVILNFLERQYDKPSDRPAAVRQRVRNVRVSRPQRPRAAGVTPSRRPGIADVAPQRREEEKRVEKTPSVVSPTANGTILTTDQTALVRTWNQAIARARPDQREQRILEALRELAPALGYRTSDQVRAIMLHVAAAEPLEASVP